MSTISPVEMLKRARERQKIMELAKQKIVAVGIIDDIKYPKNNASVAMVGAVHEYGVGLPARSFLQVPFAINEKEIEESITSNLVDALEGKKSIDNALGIIGVVATNISKKAFTTNGYGTWAPLKQGTIDKKGSSQTMIDSGILRRAVTHEVRPK